MHLVTKILIVFAALFAVLLAALAMAFSYNAQTIRDSVMAERAESAAARTALNEAQTAATKEIANAKQASEQANAALNAMRTDYANMQNERSVLQANLKAKELEADKAKNESSAKDARLDTLTKLVAAVTGENAALRTDFVRLSKEGTEKDVALADLQSQVQVATQNVRATQEQMADMITAQNKAATSGTGSRSGTEVTTGPLITAKVSKTAKAPSGDELAFISVGSAAGVKVGQKMNIVRGGNFVGTLVILTADVNEAVGRISMLGADAKVMADDTVLSRVN